LAKLGSACAAGSQDKYFSATCMIESCGGRRRQVRTAAEGISAQPHTIWS
jgi:hypothetical protein